MTHRVILWSVRGFWATEIWEMQVLAGVFCIGQYTCAVCENGYLTALTDHDSHQIDESLTCDACRAAREVCV